MDVLFAQRDLRDAQTSLVERKQQQLSAIVNTYQALGGGLLPLDYPGSTFVPTPADPAPPGSAGELLPPGWTPSTPAAEPLPDAIRPMPEANAARSTQLVPRTIPLPEPTPGLQPPALPTLQPTLPTP